MSKLILPAVTALFLLLFYLGLPDLYSARLSFPSKRAEDESCKFCNKSIDRKDLILMLCITVFFGFIDFCGLGNRTSVESFARLNGKTAVFILDSTSGLKEIDFFTGVGYGEYTFSYSENGKDYAEAFRFTQNAGDVLRWERQALSISAPVVAVQIYGSGDAWLGEVAFYDENGNIIPATCSLQELVDEQEYVVRKYDYMNSSYFDEIYHARTAWEHLHNVYPYEISHPPLGKLIISIGILLFGMTPFGWRFSGTFFGVLMLPLMYIFIKKIFGSRRCAFCAVVVFATDFMHFVQTRIATIDTYAVFFILLMYLFMYLFVSEENLSSLAFSGLFFGLGAASKWTCLYAGAGLAVIWAVYWIVNRKKGLSAFLKNSLLCVIFFIVLPCLIYYLSYLPYARARGIQGCFSREGLNILLDNQKYMFSYHSNLVAEHPYSSVWYQWVLNIRPILYYLQYYDDGTRSSFGAFLNPALCWGGLLALFVLLFRAIALCEKEALFILAGYFAQLVPWIFVKRLTFEYHYFPCSIFLVLALSYVFRLFENETKRGKVYPFAFAALSGALFILFYPVLSGIRVDSRLASQLLGWLPTWPF